MPISSAAYDGQVITISYSGQGAKAVKTELGYPWISFFESHDPRSDPRSFDGKLPFDRINKEMPAISYPTPPPPRCRKNIAPKTTNPA